MMIKRDFRDPISQGLELHLLHLFLQMKHKETLAAAPSAAAGLNKPIKKEGGLVSQMASKFQQHDTSVISPTATSLPLATTTTTAPSSVRLKKTSDSVLYSKESSILNAKKNSLVSRTESHQARFNSARAMFEKMGSADDLDSISSDKNRGSRASSVQRSRSTSPFNSKINVASNPPRSPDQPQVL